MLTVPKLKRGLSGIYLIQNKITNTFYLGSTVCLHNRLRQHKQSLQSNQHKNSRLMKDYVEYGADAFTVRVLIRCPEDDLLKHEQNLLDLFKRHYPTYHNGCDVTKPALGTTRPDYHATGKRTLDEWRDKALSTLSDKRNSDPELAEKYRQAGKKSMARLRATPDIEAKRKANAAMAQSRPEVKEKKRLAMLERWRNGGIVRDSPPPVTRQKVVHIPTNRAFDSLTQAAEAFGVSVSRISVWVHGRNYKGRRVGFNKDWSLYGQTDL